MKKGFTLVEVTVAIGLLVMMLFFSSLIFKVSIGSHRLAGANAEIMQKFRAITDQLNSDFQGLQKDAPLLIMFYQPDPTRPDQRFDQIMFFANGDFQSTQVYDYDLSGSFKIPSLSGTPVVGNVARIYYGQAQSLDSRDNAIKGPVNLLEQNRMLARRMHILTADVDFDPWPIASNVSGSFGDYDDIDPLSGYFKNEIYEHDSVSLSQWKTIQKGVYGPIISTCFGFRPTINRNNPNVSYHKLMCEHRGSFAIQWIYLDPMNTSAPGDDVFRWFPSYDPDSHFLLNATNQFGVHFEIPGSGISGWPVVESLIYNSLTGQQFNPDFYPKALKFTFTLYDSNRVIKSGRTFTHIVYIGD